MIKSIFEQEPPSWIANQLNGKSAQENYNAFVKERQEWIQNLQMEKQMEKDIEEQIYNTVEKALDDLFGDFVIKI